MSYTKSDIIRDLRKIGLKQGDVCVARGSLRSIGPIEGKRSQIVLDALLETVGDEGTICVLSFTREYELPIDPDDPKFLYTQETLPYSGGLPIECVKHPKSVRSKHPVTSFCAIGKDAHFLIDEHGVDSPSYLPIGKTVEKKGKLLIIGWPNAGPGFTTVHWAQWLQGLSIKNKKKGTQGVYYIDENGNKRLFVRKDIGGCSRAFDKFYEHYRNAGILREGMIGDAKSMLIDAGNALAIEIELIKKDPTFPLCDEPTCRQCRVDWEYSDTPAILFYLHPSNLRAKLRKWFKRNLKS